jgi:nucleoid-associated protein YgaU
MAEDLFQTLKEKYVSALSVLNREDFHVHNLNVESGKLLIKADAPSQEANNHFWDAVRRIDSNYSKDLNAQITVRPQPAPAPASPKPQVTPVEGQASTQKRVAEDAYIVVKGDTLSKIAKHFYGNANEYMRIFEANKDQLKDPDKIQIGQVLKIPPKKEV